MPARRFLRLALAVLAAACGRDVDPPRPADATIPPAAFAAVVSELAVARAELLPDSGAYRARMAQVLARHQVTPAQLHAFAAGYDGNEDVFQPIYVATRARLDSLFGPTGMAPATEPEAFPGDSVTPAATPAPAPADTTARSAPAPADTTARAAPAPTDTAPPAARDTAPRG